MIDPGPDHLLELRQVIYPSVNRRPPPSLAAAEALGLRCLATESLQYRTAPLAQPELADLLAMTPYLYRATQAGRAAAQALDRLPVTVDVVIRTLAD